MIYDLLFIQKRLSMHREQKRLRRASRSLIKENIEEKEEKEVQESSCSFSPAVRERESSEIHKGEGSESFRFPGAYPDSRKEEAEHDSGLIFPDWKGADPESRKELYCPQRSR